MKVFLPYRAEFGFIVMVHAPQVHHVISQGSGCVVCCEKQLEALYPGAQGYHHVDRREDDQRREFLEPALFEKIIKRLPILCSPDLKLEFIEPDATAPRSYFIPEPCWPIEIGNPDVVICPRKRNYGSDKNWGHWQTLADQLAKNDLTVFAAGAPDSSEHIATNGGEAWHFQRFLDATIAAMLSARLVIATDNGLAHLAVLCGKPLLMISYKNGLVAPGCDDVGNDYWPIKLDRYKRENHCDQLIDVLHDSWNDPEKVLDKTRSLLCES